MARPHPASAPRRGCRRCVAWVLLATFLILPAVPDALSTELAQLRRRAFTEHELKAAYLLKFPPYVRFPATPDVVSPDAVVVGILEPVPFSQDLLAQLDGRRVVAGLGGAPPSAHPLRIVVAAQLADLPACHVLYVPAGSRPDPAELARRSQADGTLVVLDDRAPSHLSGAIRFRVVLDTVRFEIDMDAAAASGIKFDALFLAQAARVTGSVRPGPGRTSP